MSEQEFMQLEALTALVNHLAIELDPQHLSIGELLRYEGIITGMVDGMTLIQKKLRRQLETSTN